ncbi:exported hypothetical protein [Candidatus Sulfotelmatobacter sp. SbA7]|nr:exported hypothetical protein [Candidatus Sulfotelmatobacter sp. SbA7]
MKFAAAAWAILMGSFALGQTAPIVKAWDATNITWQHVDPDGTKHSILEGDKDAPGKAFTYAVFVPAGAWDNFTHSHNQDARVAVVSGHSCLLSVQIQTRRGQGVIQPGALCSYLPIWSTRWVLT